MSVLETLQLFDKSLIGFLLEINFKFTLNAFMTVKHVCVCQNQNFCSGAPSSSQVVFLMKKYIEMILNVMYSVTTNKQKHTRLKVWHVSSFLCEITVYTALFLCE